jgi:uncharacterized protein YukE
MTETAESPEVAAILAELAGVTSAIHATWAGYDNVALSGETMLEWRDRLARCSELVAEFGWRADADRAALARERRRVVAMRTALESIRRQAEDENESSNPARVLRNVRWTADSALAPQPAENVPQDGARMPLQRPQGPERANGAGVPETGRKTGGIER